MKSQARNHLIVLLQAMEEDMLSQEQARELAALLESSKEARQLYIDYQFQAMNLDLYAHASELSPHNIAQGNWPGWMDKASSGTADALAELARLHEEGLKQPIDIELHNKKRAQHTHAGQGQPLRLKTKLIVTGSLAAMIALAGLTVLVVNLFTDPEQPIVEQLDDAIVVATLTDANGAVWENQDGDEINLPINSQMTQGQHLALTEGFAEITTNRGAIAILEAPAAIEFIDSPNAIRLHAGKLVGICETESSKGFLVRTPHLDVTDLGTRFGVDASNQDATEVHVFDGLVEIARPVPQSGNSIEQTRLSVGEAVRVASGSQVMTQLSTDTQRFASLAPIVIDLRASGQGLSHGQPDSRWLVISREGVSLDKPGVPRVTTKKRPEEKNHSALGASQRLLWEQTQRVADNLESFVFQTEVQIPDSIDPDSARITLSCAADNRLVAFYVNGQRVAVNPGKVMYAMEPYVIDQHLVSGRNTIGFEIENIWEERHKKNSVGLRVVWQLRGTPLHGTLPTDSN